MHKLLLCAAVFAFLFFTGVFLLNLIEANIELQKAEYDVNMIPTLFLWGLSGALLALEITCWL